MLKNLVALTIALIFLPAYTQDDSQPWENGGTFFSETELKPVDELTKRCPQFRNPKGVCVYNYPVLDETCTIAETRELGVFGMSQYLLLRTQQAVTFDEGDGNTYTCKADEAALIEMPGKGQARLAWHSATEREYLFISDVKLFHSASGEEVLAVLYCLNGTGGCVQSPLIWTGNKWEKLERDGSWDPVYEKLPEGYRRHKSPPIDFSHLTWEEHLAGPEDPNCCPSGKIDFQLAIRDKKLSVKSYKIVVPMQEKDSSR